MAESGEDSRTLGKNLQGSHSETKRTYKRRIAALTILLDKVKRKVLQQALHAVPFAKQLQTVDMMAYDGVDLPVATYVRRAPPTNIPTSSALVPQTTQSQRYTIKQALPAQRNKAPNKALAMDQRFAWLWSFAGGDRVCAIIGRNTSATQLLKSGDTPSQLSAIMDASSVCREELDAESATHFYNTDGHPTNLQCERKLSRRGRRTFCHYNSLESLCCQHKLCHVADVGTEPFEDAVLLQETLS